MNSPGAVENLSVAERYYLSHKKSMSEYQKRNKDKIKEKNKKYLERISEDPERRKTYLDKKREYYLKITKPKLDKLKTENATQSTVSV
jgi:hypothetical protein